MRDLCGLALLAVLVALLAPSEGHAQKQQVLNILNNGKPAPEVSVFVFTNQGKQLVATADATGQADFDFSALNLGKGTRVEVWVRRCVDGEVEIILKVEGVEEDPCVEEDAQEGERCGCELLGIVVLGDGPIWVDFGTGEVDQQPEDDGGPDASPGPTVTLGFKTDAAFFSQLEDTCSEVPDSSCSADQSQVMLGPFLEVRLFGPVQGGASVFFAQPSVDQTFQTSADPTLPSQSQGEIDVWVFDLYGKASRWFTPRVSVFGILGGAWIRNKGQFTLTFPQGDESREVTETIRAFRAGVGLDTRIGNSVGLRFNYDYRTGGADRQHALGAGIAYFFLP